VLPDLAVPETAGTVEARQPRLFAAESRTTDAPPRTTVFAAAKREIEPRAASGTHVGAVTYSGARRRPARAAPASASGKFSPVDRNRVSLVAPEKKASLMAAAVAYRSAPPTRVTLYDLLSWLWMPAETAP